MKKNRELIELEQRINASKGILDLSKLTPAQRAMYEETRKIKAKRHAERHGLNMYNYHSPCGRMQTSLPPARHQRVFNHKQNKVITIKHF